MVKNTDYQGHGRNATGVSRRRFLGAAGATGVALGVAGCVGGDDDDDGGAADIDTDEDVDEEVTVELTADQDWADVQDEIVPALHDAGLSDNINVEILPGDFETGERQADFTGALDAERSSPDIFMMDSGWTIPFIVREQVVNLQEALSDETLDYIQSDYLDAAVQTASHPETGDLYGVPVFPDYPVMQYRKDLVEEAGYDPDGENWATEPMSWQEFAEMAADVWEYHGGEDEYDYAFTTQGDNYEGTSCCTFNEMMTSFGGAYFGDHENLFGPIGDRPITVQDDAVVETIQVMRSFMHGPDADGAHPDYPQIANSDLVEFTEEPAREPFTAGNAIFHRNWPYAIAINDGEFGDDFDTMPLPYGRQDGNFEGTGGTAHALGGWHLTLNPFSNNLNAAAQVLEAFASENVMNTAFRAGGWLPPDPNVTAAADEETAGDMARFLDTLAVAGENTVARPVTVVWPDQSPLISDEIHSAYTGDKSPEEAMADLEDRLEPTEQS